MSRNYFIILVCLLGTLGAGAQELERSYFGARVGMQVTFPTGSENTYGTGAGFHGGVIYHKSLPMHLFLEPGVFFSHSAMANRRPFAYDGYVFNGTATVASFRIPFYVGYSFKPSRVLDVGVATGPAVNFNISARQGFDPNFDAPLPIPAKKIDMFDHGWKHVDGLWGIKLNMNFADHYFVGVSGELSFTPLAVYGNGDKKIKIHRNSVAVTFGYNF